MAEMPRPRPPHLHQQVNRQGKIVWYYRRGHGPRIRIRARFGTPEFDAEYQAAVGRQGRLALPKETNGTVAWLLARYRETTTWSSLSNATRRQRENIFKQMIAAIGQEPYVRVTSATLTAVRDRRRQTPAQARNVLDAMRGLFGWACESGLVAIDPSVGVKNPPRKNGPGFIPWTEEHVESYRSRWAVGTRQRIWMEVLLQTGLRRGDAVTFGRQHIRIVEGIKVAVLPTEKSQGDVPAIFPITPELEKIMAGGPCGDLTIICGAGGRSFAKEVFGNEFRGACKAAGVPGSADGLRKLASIRAAHKGATTAQMRALFGWTTDAMPSLYTKAADRMRLALEGAAVLANKKRSSIPSLRRQAPSLRQKG